jgi:hypothetical protein
MSNSVSNQSLWTLNFWKTTLLWQIRQIFVTAMKATVLRSHLIELATCSMPISNIQKCAAEMMHSIAQHSIA